MFGKFNLFSNLSRFLSTNCVRHKSSDKADKLIQLHYDNKYLFGAKVKEQKTTKKTKIPEAKVEIPETNKNEMSTEIYWMTQHVPVLDFTKPGKETKKRTVKPKKIVDKAEKIRKVPVEKLQNLEPMSEIITKPNAKIIRKEIIQPEVKIPNSLKHLDDLPKPTKINIKSSLEKSLKREQPLSAVPSQDPLDIPFDPKQIKSLPSFPLALNTKTSKTLSKFQEFEKEQSPPIPIPSVSKILQATMPITSRNALIQWKSLKIAELGLEGFEMLQKSHLDRGKQFHYCLQKHFCGEVLDDCDFETVQEIWASIEPVLETFESPGILVEERIFHPYLYYKGVVDCVSLYESTPAVIEWKKSDRQKKKVDFTFDAPLQLCSYLGALNARKEFRDKPIKSGVIVVAYNNGSPADVFKLSESDLKRYWRLYLHRLQEYWIRFRDNTLPMDPI